MEDAALQNAARDLVSPVRPTREQAERDVIAAGRASVPHLVAVLESEEAGAPVGRVALILGAMKAREAIGGLLRHATEATPGDDRALVARALAELIDGRDAFDDRVREALESLSLSPDLYTRAFAAQGFGALGDVRSRSRVEALAADPEPWVRDKAEAVLTELRRAEIEASGGGFAEFAALASQAQAEGGRLKPWLDDLGDSRRQVRDAAVAQLIGAGKEAIPFLIGALNQPKARPRIGAAQALGQLQSPEAAGPLLIAATAPADTPEELELRPVALRALANCLTGTEEGLGEGLLPLAKDPDRFVRAAALLCLGRIADRRGISAVVESLTDPDPFVVESASIALSEGVREDDEEIVLALLEAFDSHPRRGVSALREAILIALSRVEVKGPAQIVRVRHRVRREVDGPTAALRKSAIALLERLHTVDDPAVLPALDSVMGRLRDDHPEVRVVAAAFLAAHLPAGFTDAVPRLEQAIAKNERTLSLLCLEALRRHDTPSARDALVRATHDEDSSVALRAAELVDGFEPGTEEWAFVPRKRAATKSPARGVSQRPVEQPKRVKALTDLPQPATESGEGPAADSAAEHKAEPAPVAARFGPSALPTSFKPKRSGHEPARAKEQEPKAEAVKADDISPAAVTPKFPEAAPPDARGEADEPMPGPSEPDPGPQPGK